MMRAREDKIRTFMQLELNACLEEVSWARRCHNYEVLGCEQEEYPARLLPTLPPSYEDNLQSRLIRAQKGIYPASLKMILKSEYQLPVLRQVTPSSSSVFGLTVFSILSVVPRRGLQQCYNNISVFILVWHVFMSTLLTKPIVQHHLSRVSPIQLRDFPLH